MDSPVVTASVVAPPTESVPHRRESLTEAGSSVEVDSSAAAPYAASIRAVGRYALHTPAAAAAVVSSTRAPAASSCSSSTAESPFFAAGSPSAAAASSIGAHATAAKRLSIADYSAKALPLLLPLTAQTSSPSRVKFRKQLLRRMGLLPSGVSEQQQQQPSQQQDEFPRQQDNWQQQRVEAGVPRPTTRADSAAAVDEASSNKINDRGDGKENCWAYIHPVKTAKELRCMCAQLVDAFRVCYMTDQDLYFADAALQQQEHRRSSSRRRTRNSSRGPAAEKSAPHARAGSTSTTASRLRDISAAAAEKATAELAGEEEAVVAIGDNAASGPAVSACARAATGETPDSGKTCSCCCCFCCRCCLSNEDEEGLFEEWGQLAHCESPSNLRRALFEIRSRLYAAAASSAAAASAACPGCRGKVLAVAADLRAAAVSSIAPMDSHAAAPEPAASVAPVPLLRPQLKQQSIYCGRSTTSQEEAGDAVARKAALHISTKKRLLVQHEHRTPITAKESPIDTEEPELPVAQDRGSPLSFLTLYIMHLQHLINRFCAPANEEHGSSSSNKSVSFIAAGLTGKGGKSLDAADDKGPETRGHEAERKQLREQEKQGRLQQLQQQKCEQQQEEEQEQQELDGESMEEQEILRRCHAEAKKLGVYIHPDVQLKKSRKATGRGLFAARRIAAGSVLFEIPQTAMVNVYTALQDPVFSPVAEWLLTLRPEEEELQQQRFVPEEKEELRLRQERVHRELGAERCAACARKEPTAVNTKAEGSAAGAATRVCDAAGRNADVALVSLLDLSGEGRPLVDADTLCLLFFLFEAYRAAQAPSSSRKRGIEKGRNPLPESQRQQLEQLPQRHKLGPKQQSEQPEGQADDEEEEENQKGSRFSFFFELLPARHEEQQQPLMAGPPEVPELLQHVPLSRAIDSSLLRSFDLYRHLLPLLKGAFAADHHAADQHYPDEELQQQQRETLRQQRAECTQGQQHQDKEKVKQASKIVHSSDCSSYEAKLGEAASKAAAASTGVAAAPAASTTATSLAGARAAEKGHSELKEWIDSLTLEQFIWGQCQMGSRAFALQIPPPRDDKRWRRVAVHQHEDGAAEDKEEEARGEATTQGNVEAFAAAGRAVQEAGGEVRAAGATASTASRESAPAAGREEHAEVLALQEGKPDPCLGQEQAADSQYEEVEEEEDVVAFLPMLRDRPPRGRSLYCRCTGAAAARSSSSPSSLWSHSSPVADSPVNPSFDYATTGRSPSSFIISESPHATSAYTAAAAAAAARHGDAVAAVAAASDDSSRTSCDLKRNAEGAGAGEKSVREKEKEDGRVKDGRAENDLARSPSSAAAPAVTGRRRGVLHVPDHSTTFLPFVDLANHHVHAQCCFPFFDATTATAKVVAHADIPAGAELFLFYGPLQSWELLAQFGFTTNSFFALEKGKKERHHPSWKHLRQQRLLQQHQEQRQQQRQQSPPRGGAILTAARVEEEQTEEKKNARGATRGPEEDLQRWDCCGAWSFTKEKHGNPYDTLTLCFEPADDEEEEKSSPRKRQLLSRLFDISAESLLRTGAPHFSPRLLESLQISLHPDVDQLLRLLLRKKKKQQQHLRQGGGRCNNNNESSRCCERNENNVCHIKDVRQQWLTVSKKEESDFDNEEEEEEDEAEEEELQTLYKTPVVQTVNELMRPCLEALEQLEYWKEHEEERPHWYDAWSSRAAGLLNNQKVLFQKVKDLFDCSLPF